MAYSNASARYSYIVHENTCEQFYHPPPQQFMQHPGQPYAPCWPQLPQQFLPQLYGPGPFVHPVHQQFMPQTQPQQPYGPFVQPAQQQFVPQPLQPFEHQPLQPFEHQPHPSHHTQEYPATVIEQNASTTRFQASKHHRPTRRTVSRLAKKSDYRALRAANEVIRSYPNHLMKGIFEFLE